MASYEAHDSISVARFAAVAAKLMLPISHHLSTLDISAT
jgi:hypothetical protein